MSYIEITYIFTDLTIMNKKTTLTFLIKGEALIRGEGGKFDKINKRGGSNKRGGWKFCQN